jgi:predicted RNA-binding protein YlqC (UPF0109 family)
MGDGSMFEEPDFGHAQTKETDDGYDDAEDVADDDDVEDDDTEDEAVEADADDDDADGDEDEDDDDADDDDEDDEDDAEDADDGNEAEEEAVNRLHGATARAVLEHVTRALVDDPDSVVVEVSEGRSGLRFSVHVAQGDMGRLIGRKGRTAQAIRTLVRAAAATDGTEASVDIVD